MHSTALDGEELCHAGSLIVFSYFVPEVVRTVSVSGRPETSSTPNRPNEHTTP